jgi:two-component system, NarL family, response regulator YdfI
LHKRDLALIGLKLDSVIGSPGLTAAARAELRSVRADIATAVHNQAAREVIDAMTPSEMRVLESLSRGLATKAISEELFLSVATVKTHLAAIYQKLDVSSRAQAIVIAEKLGLVI